MGSLIRPLFREGTRKEVNVGLGSGLRIIICGACPLVLKAPLGAPLSPGLPDGGREGRGLLKISLTTEWGLDSIRLPQEVQRKYRDSTVVNLS